MKTLIKLFVLVFVVVITAKTVVEDAAKANPKFVKVLCDTMGVRMSKVTWQPGEEMAVHTHPVQQIYVLKGGQLTVTHQDGSKPAVYDMKAGDAFQDKEEIAHTTKNTGKTTVEIILVEITPQPHQH